MPMISEGGSLERYRQTLERLTPLIEAAETVVAGHGGPLEREWATAVLLEDLEYLDHLGREGGGATLPPGRRSPTQRAIHARNADAL
jgi:hypothetical protein